MKGKPPVVLPAVFGESRDNPADLVLRAHGIGQDQGEVPSHLVGQEALSGGREEKGLVRPELEGFHRGPSVTFDDLPRLGPLLRQGPEPVDDRPEEGIKGVEEAGDGDEIE